LVKALDDEFNGWLDDRIIRRFLQYAEVAFLNFGDRVKNWITFNEPLTFVNLGYSVGMHAPGRCSDRAKCDAGNSSTEPYIVAHNVIRSHGYAVQLYRELKQVIATYPFTSCHTFRLHPSRLNSLLLQSSPHILQGQIGITLNCDFAEPRSDSSEDISVSQKYLEFQLAWWADPIFFGKYPDSMVEQVGDRLPKFTDDEVEIIKGTHDYFGLNHVSVEVLETGAECGC